MFKVKRLPEVVFFLNCEFDKMVNRIVNEDEIKEKYNNLLKDKRTEKQKEIDEMVVEKREAGEEEADIEGEIKNAWVEFDTDIEDNFK